MAAEQNVQAGAKVKALIRRIFCAHRSNEWKTTTEVDRGLTVAVTRGGCVQCGKKYPEPQPQYEVVFKREGS